MLRRSSSFTVFPMYKSVEPIDLRRVTTYPLAEIHDAQRAFLAKTFVGNIVLVPPPD